MNIPGILIAAGASGSGKTAIACGIMAALKQRGLRVAACKCGPDYIDPMFHREVLGIPSENLDLFFSSAGKLKNLLLRHAEHADIVVTEGVMGYYDGLSLGSWEASSYDVSRTLRIPTILVVPCRGMALSVVPAILGMLEFRPDSGIRGIILNRISGTLYPRMKEMIETELQNRGYGIPVIGYVPEDEAFHMESRHLGLVLPGETAQIRERLQKAGGLLSETVELEKLIEIAKRGSKFDVEEIAHETVRQAGPRIGVARDEAFCFYYEENLEMLRRAGCEVVPFSPLHDTQMPERIDGMMLGGGYPELYARQLSENITMREQIRTKIESGMPCIAECGGFLYLHKELEDSDDVKYPMVGVIYGNAYPTKRLGRFGYIHLKAEKNGIYLRCGEEIKCHEFHYWDSTDNGTDCLAVKPDGKRFWKCMHMEGALFAGFAHLYLASNPEFTERFAAECRKYGRRAAGGMD